jgi:hypothetical protein
MLDIIIKAMKFQRLYDQAIYGIEPLPANYQEQLVGLLGEILRLLEDENTSDEELADTKNFFQLILEGLKEE